jgi:hypothetical protein
MNALWPSWITSSVMKHFDDGIDKQDFYLGQRGFEKRSINETLDKDYVELRLDGPFIDEHTKNNFKIVIVINTLVVCPKDECDTLHAEKSTGKILELFTKTIQVFMSSVEEPLACLYLDSRIDITPFGAVPPESRLLQTSIEAQYKMLIIDN